jgi:hypothetical protein
LFALGSGNVVKLGVDAEILFDGEIDVAGQGVWNYANGALGVVGIGGQVLSGNTRFFKGI